VNRDFNDPCRRFIHHFPQSIGLMNLRPRAGVLALLALGLGPISAMACSSCGCTLSSDWDSETFSASGGWHLDLRYDALNQSQLRSGTHAVHRADFSLPNEQEIQIDTMHRYATLAMGRSFGTHWGIDVQLPVIDRDHSTVTEGDTEPSFSHGRGLGDIRVLARYQGFGEDKNSGLQFGLKLPTGRHDDTFIDGPSIGEELDRGLQLGSGTYDALLGAYHFGALAQNWDYFAQVLAQIPLDSRDGYRPGRALNANVGLRYMAWNAWQPQLQLNAKVSARDSGFDADIDNSGGTLVDISPGLSYRVDKSFSVYSFMQFPLYQRVNGLQLAPRATMSLGLRYAF
jgi:hypothetical protein